ncbi:MAG: hypothetical protein RL562_1674 [Planctomycetota bacterium]
MTQVSPSHLAAIAAAFDVDPFDIRADTPVEVLGWTGSATDWLLAADHLGVRMTREPDGSSSDPTDVATIADVVAIVFSSGDVQSAERG